ncbi:MAG: penicillin-binding protein [Thermodesulfobacteriota bacterium]
MTSGGRWVNIRIAVVIGAFAVFFGVVWARAFCLQVVERERLSRIAKNQHERVVKMPSQRGGIFDRNHEELAVSIEVDSVFARPSEVENSARASSAISKAVEVSPAALKRSLDSEKRFVWIKRQVDLASDKREAINGVKGAGTVKEMRRFYPNRALGANLVGFVGIDSNGLEGIERHYDGYLKGETVTVRAERDAGGRLLLYGDVEDGTNGMDAVLTIDKNIQYFAERALAKAVAKFRAKAGAALVMDPVTGEILAMANLPSYDPNDFKRFSPHDRRNRIVTDAFEPGSTIKPFLLAAALEEGVVKLDDSFFCENGRYKVADRTFHDKKKYGNLSAREIIKYSSNIGAAKMGERLGQRRYYRYLNEFGFGAKTGIDLPGEATGILRHYNAWSGVSLQTMSFGQGFSATALQVATAMSAVANGGFIVKPYVVKSIKDNSGVVIKEFNPSVVRRVISEETAGKVTETLTGVTEKGGTGELAALGAEFKVAGKTGTAQKPDLKQGGYEKNKYVVSFTGFVPADNPKLTIFVALDEPEGDITGGVAAAPVFREIAFESLSYMGVFPAGTFKEGEPIELKTAKVVSGKAEGKITPFYKGAGLPLPRSIATGSGGIKEEGFEEETVPSDAANAVMPDFRGKTMREVLKAASKRDVDVDFRGSGIAVSQRPSPGTVIPKNKTAIVVFQ